MNDTKKYQKYNLKITVNKKLKHSYISIDKDKNVLVKTPYKSQSFIDSLLLEKRDWIEKRLLKIEELTLINSEEIYSKEYLQERLEFYSDSMNLPFRELKFRKMRSRWGSCSSQKVITLNTKLCCVKKELIDYVIVHELAHLKHMNHSKEFHMFVESHLPNSKSYRKELQNIRLT